ncbi:uncharacterized protein Z518_08352 [Rhinocladiella mackenziei CBS 650.93]|uniref:Actin-like ATPase domain-containing protein n=1 Tax=Rhinocladiella mackenziei CBS 650.93 TaxID=1442369 RepID=A0A0D2IGK5_9EURO|nr:uncharacterized protein Z518_08352 [Rhinocladiella mackenziei CBS 650.93]KIX02411.1 hypothetical protein Z518_08352 [Rhinocladiella mackenziei CBS 650.93]
MESAFEDLAVFESDDQIIIALDFGTTFSGIAYAFKTDSKPELVSVLDWPGLESEKQPKTPTVISYDPKSKRSFTWGAQAHKHVKIEGIKLLLDPEQDKPVYVPATNTRAELAKLGKPPVEVVADYIRSIYEHALERIATKVPEEYLENEVQKKFVISVPAVWSDRAKDATLRAAKLAGIYPVTLIKEPEAAAMYTLHVLQDRGLGVGDALVICDAGGGTVDLISYEILQKRPTLQLKELVPSKGGIAGSLQLNKRFEEQVKMLVGEDQYYHLRKTPAYDQAVKFFDRTVKPEFRGKKDVSWYVNFPMADLEDDESQGLKRDSWELKSDVVETIFSPLIEDIGRMVDDQVNLVQKKRLVQNHSKGAEVKAIFLVGGFGASEYLKQNIQRRHPDIQVIQPHDAWAAIVKGAVLSQLPNEALITSVVAPRHYGVKAHWRYDPVKDAGQKSWYDSSHGHLRVDQMTWYIEKGEDLQREQKISFPFFRRLPYDYQDSDLVFTDTLYSDESARANNYPKEGIVKANCTLSADLRSIDRSMLKEKVCADGKTYVDVNYDLVVSLKSALMRFSLEIKGKEFGSVAAKYE